jgi:chromosome segregation ATPase
MAMEVLPWILGALGLFASLLAGVRLRQVGLAQAASQLEVVRLNGELQAAREQLEKASAKQRRSAEELADLRKRLDKLRRREGKGPKGPASIGTSGAQLQALERELEETRQVRDAARSEATGLSLELTRLRAERSEPPPERPSLDNAAIESLQASQREAAEQGDSRARKLQAAATEIARLKGKVGTQESLYVSMRGELEAKKDRLRRQQEEIERLQALKVVVVDPDPDADLKPTPTPPPVEAPLPTDAPEATDE